MKKTQDREVGIQPEFKERVVISPRTQKTVQALINKSQKERVVISPRTQETVQGIIEKAKIDALELRR